MNIFATLMILFSSCAIAFIIINKERRHCVMLEESVRLINIIKSRAVHYAEPLPDIILNIAGKNGRFLNEFCELFNEHKDLPEDIPERWKTTVDCFFGQHLEDYECDVLIHFGEELCTCNSNDIEKIYSNAEYSLNEFLITAKQKRNSGARSTAAISVSVGIMIVLMLV